MLSGMNNVNYPQASIIHDNLFASVLLMAVFHHQYQCYCIRRLAKISRRLGQIYRSQETLTIACNNWCLIRGLSWCVMVSQGQSWCVVNHLMSD